MVIVQPVALTAPRGPHDHRPIKSQGVTIAYRNTSQHIRGPASTAKLRTAPQHGLAHQILAPAKPPAIIRDTPSCARPVAPSEHNGNPTVKKHHIMSKAPYCRTYVTHANQIPAQRTNLYFTNQFIKLTPQIDDSTDHVSAPEQNPDSSGRIPNRVIQKEVPIPYILSQVHTSNIKTIPQQRRVPQPPNLGAVYSVAGSIFTDSIVDRNVPPEDSIVG